MKTMKTILITILALGSILSAEPIANQTVNQLLANRSGKTTTYAGSPEEADYWTNTEIAARVNEICTALQAKAVSDTSYKPTEQEADLMNIWWNSKEGGSQKYSEGAKSFFTRTKGSPAETYSQNKVTRFVTTSQEYDKVKSDGFVVLGLTLSPASVAHLATVYGDFVTIDGLDHSKILGWPYTSGDYLQWVNFKFRNITSPQARYDMLQNEIDTISTLPKDGQNEKMLATITQMSDALYARLRRAALLK